MNDMQKIKDLETKINALKQQQEKLKQHLELKIISLLKREKAFTGDFETLYGAIYELAQKLKHDNSNHHNTDNSSEMAKWRKLGIKHLEKNKNTKPTQLDNQDSDD
jgi:hypothetical protein